MFGVAHGVAIDAGSQMRSNLGRVSGSQPNAGGRSATPLRSSLRGCAGERSKREERLALAPDAVLPSRPKQSPRNRKTRGVLSASKCRSENRIPRPTRKRSVLFVDAKFTEVQKWASCVRAPSLPESTYYHYSSNTASRGGEERNENELRQSFENNSLTKHADPAQSQ